jgi:hypothetical protein
MHLRTRLILCRYELRLLEQADVLFHPGQRYAEGLATVDGRSPGPEPFEDGAAGRVGEGCESAVNGRCILNH